MRDPTLERDMSQTTFKLPIDESEGVKTEQLLPGSKSMCVHKLMYQHNVTALCSVTELNKGA